jgi:hypothetical protein
MLMRKSSGEAPRNMYGLVSADSMVSMFYEIANPVSVQNAALEPVTPPLSPMCLPVELYEPSMSDTGFELPILSDPASLTHVDLSILEKQIFEHDIPTPIRNALNDLDEASSGIHSGNGTVRLADLYYPQESIEMTISPPLIVDGLVKSELLKVEGPLTPLMPAPVPKTVHFSDFIEEMLLGASSSPTSDSFCKTHFEEAFGDAAERVIRQIEQETLVAADATGRVQVPVMDFSVPNPPWKILQNAQGPIISVSIQKEIIKEVVGGGLPMWPGQNRGQTKLKWNPFPHDLAKTAQQEDYPADDRTWQLLLKRPGDDQIADTSTITWKPQGLRILKEDDDYDDEIETGRFQRNNTQDIPVLTKKRRMEFDMGQNDGLEEETFKPVELTSDISDSTRAGALGRRNTSKSNDFISSKNLLGGQSDSGGFGLLIGGAFSAENAVDNFLELRGIKKQKLTSSSHFYKNNNEIQIQEQATQEEHQDRSATLRSPINDPLPFPALGLPTAPISAIVSSSLLKHRKLIKYIESQLPGLKLIERDFTSHNTIAWIPHSVTRSPQASPLDSEADLIVSPFTGIILTTLQKIKQKPLPGHKTRPAIRDRLEKASVRYDKLVILVSEGRSAESTNGLDENNCNAFTEFVGFTLGLDATILVQFVGGGEETLFKWLVNSIVQHAAIGQSLLEEETHWELFLRRAGMNAYAAQSISSVVKASESVHQQSHSKIDQVGLAGFVQMGKQQRIDMFQEVCGKRLLERVSAGLDAIWD